MLEKLSGSPISWAVLAVVAIASFIYAIICQHKNKENREFSCYKRTNQLIQGQKRKFEKLAITYDGKSIENLTVSKLIIWNSGNRTINKIDIVESKELSISALSDSRILDIEIIASTEETNNFVIESKDEHSAKISFDYADKKDGIVVQVMHTGSNEDIKPDCKIKGGKPIKITGRNLVPKSKRKRLIILISIEIILYVLFIISILQKGFVYVGDAQDIFKAKIILTISILTPVTFLMFFYISVLKDIFNIGIPKKLRKYSDF